jgi:hypothetical protein
MRNCPRRRCEDRQRQPAPVALELSAALIVILEDEFPDEDLPKVPADD